VFDVPVVTNSRTFCFVREAAGAVVAPAFPAPSVFTRVHLRKTRAHRAAGTRNCVSRIWNYGAARDGQSGQGALMCRPPICQLTQLTTAKASPIQPRLRPRRQRQ